MSPPPRRSSSGPPKARGSRALAPPLKAAEPTQWEHLPAIFEHLPAGIVFMDNAGCILAVNPAFEQRAARSTESLVGQRLADVLAAVGASLQPLIEEVARTGQTARCQNWLLPFGDAGSPAFWDCAICPTRGPEGSIAGLLLLITDVTDRALEQQRLSEEVADRLQRSERLSTLGTLTSAIGHELRNPLGIIRNAAHMLGQRPDDPERVARLSAVIQAEVQRATKVITDVLDFVRVRAPRRHPVGIPGLVAETLERVGVPENIAVHCIVPPDLPLLRLDGQQMGQVLENLIRNAVEAMPDGGVLVIEARLVAGQLDLRVTDNGPGVPPEDRERIFEALFTTRRAGTGIGLAISKRLVEAHGGIMAVEAAPGPGATFVVSVPVPGSDGEGG